MSEIYFVNLDIHIARPAQIVDLEGTMQTEVYRRFTVSLPIRDKTRAEELLDHFAKGLAAIFKEVEVHDQAQREAARAAGLDSGGAVPSGNDLKIVVDPSGQIPGPGGEGRSVVEHHLRAVPDSTGEPEGTREES